MKKTVRVLAALLVAVILATSASAAKAIFVSPNGSGTTEQKATVATPTFTPPAETKTTATTAPGGFVFNGPAPVYTASDFPKTPAPTCLYPSYPVYTGCTAPCQPCGTYGYYGGWYRPAPYDILAGGKYYTVADARAEIDQYLARTAYNLIMTEGERRTICEGAYYVSSNPSVAYYDAASGKLVANHNGSSTVYVYTKGGVPIARLDVSVLVRTTYEKRNDILYVSTDAWNIGIEESTVCTVKSASGKVYNDILFKVIRGFDYGRVGEENGKISGKANGAVIVRAYSKSNPDVYGDVLVYVGSLTAAVFDGYWVTCPTGVQVTSWGYDVSDYIAAQNAIINGWIRSAEGIFIPVIRLADAVKTNPDGTKEQTKILYGDTLSYLDLLRMAYTDRTSLTNVLAGYNTVKYGSDKIVLNALDQRTVVLAQILGLLD